MRKEGKSSLKNEKDITSEERLGILRRRADTFYAWQKRIPALRAVFGGAIGITAKNGDRVQFRGSVNENANNDATTSLATKVVERPFRAFLCKLPLLR